MEKTVKAFRVAALLGAVSAVSAVLISGATPAKAGEERLHGSTFKVYGLVPPGEGNKSSTSTNSTRTASADTVTGTTSLKSGPKRDANKNNEPKLEDPPMPTYDGPSAGGNTMASNEGATPGYN